MWKFPADGLPADNARNGLRLTHQTGQVLTPSAGPGDREVAFLSDSGGHANLWVVETPAARSGRSHTSAILTPRWGCRSGLRTAAASRSCPHAVIRGDARRLVGGSRRNQPAELANPGLGPAWSHDGRWLYYSTRGEPRAPCGRDVEENTGRWRAGRHCQDREAPQRHRLRWLDAILYVRAAAGRRHTGLRNPSRQARARAIARAGAISASRVPLWQIVNPALSPDGKWLAQPLTDGFTTNIWALSTATGEWRQITDFGTRPVFIARRVSWSADGRSILAAVGDGDADVVLLEGLTARERQ